MTVRIGIAGAAGRMGRMLAAEVLRTPGTALVAGLDAPGSEGQDLGTIAGLAPTGVTTGADPAAFLAGLDVAIDFSTAAATARLADAASGTGTRLVIGTTGLDTAETEAVERAAQTIAILRAANFSVGVNLLLGLAEQVARTLGPEYDIEILEMHHRLKIDAPSGTALAIGRAAAQGRGQPLEALWVKSRDGLTGQRPDGAIGFATLRGGGVVGDHTAIFAGPGEQLELTHKAADRSIFARGAVRAALWIAGRPAGLYGMKDLLGL